MLEQVELRGLEGNTAVAPVLLGGILEVGTERLVDYFHSATTAHDEVLTYEFLFNKPTCPMVEPNWMQALQFKPDHLLYGSRAYETIDMTVTGLEPWVRNWEASRKTVFLKNPMGLLELWGTVGATNALFAHEGILFVGTHQMASDVIQCVRPLRLSWQRDVWKSYIAVLREQATAQD